MVLDLGGSTRCKLRGVVDVIVHNERDAETENEKPHRQQTQENTPELKSP